MADYRFNRISCPLVTSTVALTAALTVALMVASTVTLTVALTVAAAGAVQSLSQCTAPGQPSRPLNLACRVLCVIHLQLPIDLAPGCSV